MIASLQMQSPYFLRPYTLLLLLLRTLFSASLHTCATMAAALHCKEARCAWMCGGGCCGLMNAQQIRAAAGMRTVLR